jgi:Flp pilus assembly protein TadG
MGQSITGRHTRRPSSRSSILSLRSANRGDTRRPSSRRRGTVCVEFALVSVPLFLFVFGMVEFGRALMAIHAMEEAARAGCRRAIVRGATVDDIKAEVTSLMGSVAIEKYNVVVEPSNLAAAERWQPVTVSIEAKYKDLNLFSGPLFLEKVKLSSSCTLANESSPED